MSTLTTSAMTMITAMTITTATATVMMITTTVMSMITITAMMTMTTVTTMIMCTAMMTTTTAMTTVTAMTTITKVMTIVTVMSMIILTITMVSIPTVIPIRMSTEIWRTSDRSSISLICRRLCADGRPVTEVHFHEVGSMDAVADITAFCLLLSLIGPEKVVVSPIKIGFGEVRCAHGILPVPAPATAWILRDVPVYAGNIRGEMCTPTGAAILKCFADEFGSLPQMQISKVGIGCGKKDFEQANIVRALLGEMEDSSKTTGTEKPEDRQAGSGDRSRETVLELSCNLDDMTPEAVGFAMEELLEAGALDVYTIPVTMKKNRPGFILNCLCRESMREKILSLMFLHTTTLGIREYLCNRYTLQRRVRTVSTDLGEVRCKTADGWGVSRRKYEYEDLAAIARKRGISLAEAVRLTEKSTH